MMANNVSAWRGLLRRQRTLRRSRWSIRFTVVSFCIHSLCDQFADDVTVNIRQTAVNAVVPEGQAGVVYA